MGLISGLSIAALTFGPVVLVYRGHEVATQQRVFIAAMIFSVIAELLKVTLVAALSISSSMAASSSIASWYQSALPFLVTVLDVYVLQLILCDPKVKRMMGSGDASARAVSIPLGWCSGQAILFRLLPLYYNASNPAFDSAALVGGVEANLEYVQIFTLCAILASSNLSSSKVATLAALTAIVPVVATIIFTPVVGGFWTPCAADAVKLAALWFGKALF